MEIDAVEGPSALTGSPILFQSSVPKFTSRSVWCAQLPLNGGDSVELSYQEHSRSLQRLWYEIVLRPILVDGLFRVCSEVSGTSRLLAYTESPTDATPTPFYSQPYIGAHKRVKNVCILSSFVECETPRQTSISTSVLTAYMRKFTQSMLFGSADALLLTTPSCASSLSPYAMSVLEQYASAAAHDQVLIVLPALTIPNGGGDVAAWTGDSSADGGASSITHIYPRVNNVRGSFLVGVRIGAVSDVSGDVSASILGPSIVPRYPSFEWTTPAQIEEGQVYTSLIAHVSVGQSTCLTSDTMPVLCTWNSDASGFVVQSEAYDASGGLYNRNATWMRSIQVTSVAILAPSLSYVTIDTSGVSRTGHDMVLQTVDLGVVSYNQLEQRIEIQSPVVLYDVDFAFMRISIWSPIINRTYQLETAPKRVTRQIKAGMVSPTLYIWDQSGNTLPIVLIKNVELWVEFTFAFLGNKTSFSGPATGILQSLVVSPAGACAVSSVTSSDGIRFGRASSPTSLLTRVTLSGDLPVQQDIQFQFQMVGSSSKIPFTLPSEFLWAFPLVKSTTIQPGVVSLGETVVFKTQFDVLHGPCPPSESWLVVNVLIAPIANSHLCRQFM